VLGSPLARDRPVRLGRGRRYVRALVAAAAAACVPSGLAQPALPVVSGFDLSAEGWTIPASVEWRGAGGNPGGYLHGPIPDPHNTVAAARAPAAYLGDWSTLDGRALIGFDHRIFDAGTVNFIIPYKVVLSGPGGRAQWDGPTAGGATPWTRLVAPVHASAWAVQSGTWAGLLANVTDLTIQIEIVDNVCCVEDQAGLDNAVLTCRADFNADGGLDTLDVLAFLNAFNAADSRADFTGDGELDSLDFLAFLNEFNAGC